MIFIFTILFQTNQTFADITSQTLRPALNPHYQTIEDAQLWGAPGVEEEESEFYRLLFNTVDSPIATFDATGANRTPLVSRTSSLQLAAMWKLLKNFQVGADAGVNMVQPTTGSSYFGISDLRAMGKYRLFSLAERFGVSVASEFFIPFKNRDEFISNNVFGGSAKLFLENDFKIFRAVVNAGYIFQPGAEYRTVNYSKLIPLGIGIKMPLNKETFLNIEGTAALVADAHIVEGPGDLYIGAQMPVLKSGSLRAGMALGSFKNDGSSSLRLLVGLDILPLAKDHTMITKIETFQKIKTTRDCSPKPYRYRFKARRLTARERALKLLPYISTAKSNIPTLQIGEKTGITYKGMPYVRDSQVIFAVDIKNLPKQSTVVSINSLDLKMKITKLLRNNPAEEKTDMICFLDEKVCSGDLYGHKEKAENINSVFFEGKEPPNDYFVRQYYHYTQKNIPGSRVYSSELNLPLEKLLENSTQTDLMNIIYQKSADSPNPKNRTVYFAVAHDVYVSTKTQLDLNLSAITCSETAPQSSESYKETRQSVSEDGK